MTNLFIKGNILFEGATAADSSQLRYVLEDNIEDAELGNVIGGGCELDTAVFDIQVETNNVEGVKKLLADLLKQAELEKEVTLEYSC